MLWKHREFEGGIREKVAKGSCVIGSLARIIKGRNVSIEVKRGLRNSIFLSPLMGGSETWAWNRTRQ